MATWTQPKLDWDSSTQGVGDGDFNRIEGNIEFLGEASHLKDFEGNSYRTAIIAGLQITVDNWSSTKYSDGSSIPLVSDQTAWDALTTPGYCKYDGGVTAFGSLYNWYAVDTALMAPEGWRVMTLDDVILLTDYLVANGYRPDRDLVPGPTPLTTNMAIPLAGAKGWASSATTYAPGQNMWRNNESGAAFAPGGYRDVTGFVGIDTYARYWLTDAQLTSTVSLHIDYNSSSVLSPLGSLETKGQSIKMVRDV